MASMGTDAGGSVRKPAAFCGVVGLKPTFGLVSRYGVISMSSTLDHCGPITKTVEDAAMIMNAICGYDDDDPTTLEVAAPAFTSELHMGIDGVRIGVDDDFLRGASESVLRSFTGAIQVLEGLGAHIVRVSLPLVDHAISASGLILTVDAAFFHQKWLREKAELYEVDTRSRLELGELVLATDYLQALQVRKRFKQAMREMFEDNNLSALIMPTATRTAAPIDSAERGDGSMASAAQDPPEHLTWNRQCAPFNLTGQPALSVPCGFSDNGLPIGLQVVGRPLEDPLILRIGASYERATDWHSMRPSL